MLILSSLSVEFMLTNYFHNVLFDSDLNIKFRHHLEDLHFLSDPNLDRVTFS